MAISDSELGRLLDDSPFVRFPFDRVSDADPIRFYRGSPASVADIEEGWALPRAIQEGAIALSFESAVEGLDRCAGNTSWILEAPTGEGKTTFLNQLAWALRSKYLPIFWEAPPRYDPLLLGSIMDAFDERVILFAELSPDLLPHMIRAMSSEINRYLSRPYPIVIAAAPRQAGCCELRGARRFSFAPRNPEFARVLSTKLHRLPVHPAARHWNLDEALPNLAAFLDSPRLDILQGSKPLLTSLLEAGYGAEFQNRLVEEATRLADSDAVAAEVYTIATYVHAVGAETPAELIGRLVPALSSGLLERFARGSPWELRPLDGGRRAVLTRHRIIAETLCLANGMLKEEAFLPFLRLLVRAGSKPFDESILKVIQRVLLGYSEWRSVSPSRFGPSRGMIRSMLRTVLVENGPLLGDLRDYARASADWGIAGGWASLMHHLVPENERYGREAEFLLSQNDEWLALAANVFPERHLPTVRFFQGKSELSRAKRDNTVRTVRPRVLALWETLLREHWDQLSPDFFQALSEEAFRQGREEAGEKTRWLRLAARAFMELLASAPERPTVLYRYREFLNWGAYVFADSREIILELLSEGWSRIANSDIEGAASIGTWYAEELFRQGDADQEAPKVLRKVLARRLWGAALVLLCEHCDEYDGMREFAESYLVEHPPSLVWGTPLNSALAFHAAAILAGKRGDLETGRKYWRSACDDYGLARAAAFVYGEEKRWQKALSEMARTDPKEAVSGNEVYKTAMAIWLKRRDK